MDISNIAGRSLKIKNITVKNRIAIPPMVCFCWSDNQGRVTDKNIQHYRELAEGGAGLIIVEATAITSRGRLADTELGIWEDGQIEGLKEIADIIHKNGSKAFIQLVHAGGNGIDKEPEAPSDKLYREDNMAHEMSKDRIIATQMDFVAAALRAQKAGFDGVEIHGCHGYLLSCFFNERTNFREDEYGIEKSLMAIETLAAVKKACGEDFIVGIRLGAFEPLLEDGLEHAKKIAPYTDFIDVSYGGDCNGYAPSDFPCSEAVYGAMQIKRELSNPNFENGQYAQIPIFGVHNINSSEDVINALKTGIDIVDVGKASLVDPAFANHVLKGETPGKCLHCKNYCRWNPWEMSDKNKICPGWSAYHK